LKKLLNLDGLKSSIEKFRDFINTFPVKLI